MYDHYYTGSDVNIYLRYPATDRQVHIDKAVGIGYNHSMSSVPIYILGNVDPAFFSRGNSLIQGNLDLAFKSVKYLQAGIRHILNKSDLISERDRLRKKAETKNSRITDQEVMRLNQLQTMAITDMSTISISQIFELFEIIIEYDNTNSNDTGTGRSGIVLEGIKFTSEGMSIRSTEESALVDRYTFLAKNVREY